PTHWGVELRLGVHQSTGRSRRAPHRYRGIEGVSHRRCLGLREARQLHHQPWEGNGQGSGAVDSTRARDSRAHAWGQVASRGPDRGGGRLMRLQYDSQALRRVTDPKEFGRVAVLFGGDSSEREISLLTGEAVLGALKGRGVDAHAFDPRERALTELVGGRFDRVWIALHGPGGEGGTLQGALEYLGVPYTGSGVMGSAIGMDKLRTKRLALAVGVPTADFLVLRGPQDFDTALARLKLPLIVKPATQGSSVGMTKVERAAELAT